MYRRSIEFVAEGTADRDKTMESYNESNEENTKSVVDFYRNLVLSIPSESSKQKLHNSITHNSETTGNVGANTMTATLNDDE
jgi:hypothetical protein